MQGEHTITLSEYKLYFLWDAIHEYEIKHRDELDEKDAETVHNLFGFLESLIQKYLEERWEDREE